MPLRLMTTQELLDLVATPMHGNEHEAVEAVRSLIGGVARTTHYFCFDRETPVQKRRWFDHMSICDRWERVSEKFLMSEYADVTWGVDDSQNMVRNWPQWTTLPLASDDTGRRAGARAGHRRSGLATEGPVDPQRRGADAASGRFDLGHAVDQGNEMIKAYCMSRGFALLNEHGLVDIVEAILHALHAPFAPHAPSGSRASRYGAELHLPKTDPRRSPGALVDDVIEGIQRFREVLKGKSDHATEDRLSMNLRGRLDVVYRVAAAGDDAQARKELLALLRYFPPPRSGCTNPR